MAKLWRRIKQTIAVLSVIIFVIFIGWRSFVHFTAYDDSLAEMEEISEDEETWETDPLDPRLVDINFMKTATFAEIKELLPKNMDIKGWTARILFHNAILYEKYEFIAFLIEEGADVNARTKGWKDASALGPRC